MTLENVCLQICSQILGFLYRAPAYLTAYCWKLLLHFSVFISSWKNFSCILSVLWVLHSCFWKSSFENYCKIGKSNHGLSMWASLQNMQSNTLALYIERQHVWLHIVKCCISVFSFHVEKGFSCNSQCFVSFPFPLLKVFILELVLHEELRHILIVGWKSFSLSAWQISCLANMQSNIVALL